MLGGVVAGGGGDDGFGADEYFFTFGHGLADVGFADEGSDVDFGSGRRRSGRFFRRGGSGGSSGGSSGSDGFGGCGGRGLSGFGFCGRSGGGRCGRGGARDTAFGEDAFDNFCDEGAVWRGDGGGGWRCGRWSSGGSWSGL